MGEAKRRRDLGHFWRTDTYSVVLRNIQGKVGITFEDLTPSNRHDAQAVQSLINSHFGPGIDEDDQPQPPEEWDDITDTLYELYEDEMDYKAVSHLRCQIKIERSQHGERVFFGRTSLELETYSTDQGQTWLPVPPFDWYLHEA